MLLSYSCLYINSGVLCCYRTAVYISTQVRCVVIVQLSIYQLMCVVLLSYSCLYINSGALCCYRTSVYILTQMRCVVIVQLSVY